jgi:UDP-N-acetylglucosamine--N-acetylmuramyl-(pentapeptide) pyrophosphoryl-undecaprenol N-acetylglucosamine transferase
MPLSLWRAVSIFRQIKPSVVLGVGGFASGPFLFISWLMGAKTALWEANAHPGLTNRWLSRIVNTSFIVFGEAAKNLPARKIIESGMPVRDEFFKPVTQAPAEKLRILVFGGSQGARAINEIVVAMVKKHPGLIQKLSIKHQTGGRDFERMQATYGMHQDKVELVEYIHDMPSELKKYDLVVCRSGASTVAEVIACRKPAIFVPLPTAADNHQYHNAKVVADKNGAIVLEQKDLTEDSLYDLLMELSADRARLQTMSDNLKQFDFTRASQTIVTSLVEGTP